MLKDYNIKQLYYVKGLVKLQLLNFIQNSLSGPQGNSHVDKLFFGDVWQLQYSDTLSLELGMILLNTHTVKHTPDHSGCSCTVNSQ